MYRGEDVQQLDYNQRREGNGHYVEEGVLENVDAHQHDHCRLKYAHSDPHKEGFQVHFSSFLQILVEQWVSEDVLQVDVFIENLVKSYFFKVIGKYQAEDREHGEYGGVSKL